jgi:hypothetical protein
MVDPLGLWPDVDLPNPLDEAEEAVSSGVDTLVDTGSDALATVGAVAQYGTDKLADGATWVKDHPMESLDIATTALTFVPVAGEAAWVLRLGVYGAQAYLAFRDTQHGDYLQAALGIIPGGRLEHLAAQCRDMQLAGHAGLDVAGFTAHLSQMSDDQRALKELVDEASRGGRVPLRRGDAEQVLDWAHEVKYPGVRAKKGDVASPSNWKANPVPHIHIPGAGRGGHVPVEPGVNPR